MQEVFVQIKYSRMLYESTVSDAEMEMGGVGLPTQTAFQSDCHRDARARREVHFY